MVYLPEKAIELDPQTLIYLDSVSPGEICIWPHRLLYKKAKNVTFAIKRNGSIGLKFCHADTTLQITLLGPISVTRGMSCACHYGNNPFFIKKEKEEAKNDTFYQKKNGTTGLKL